MRLYFIRHGDKETGDFFNPAIGHQDNPLSEKGRRQAEALVGYFRERPVARIFVSRYGRTSETSAPLASHSGLVPFLDPRLDEIDVGMRDKLDDEAFEKAFPDFMVPYRERKSDFRYPGGESGGDVIARIVPFLGEREGEGLDAVAFTHDGYIRILVCHILGLPVWKRFSFIQDTCGILELDFDAANRSYTIVRYNQTLATDA